MEILELGASLKKGSISFLLRSRLEHAKWKIHSLATVTLNAQINGHKASICIKEI